MCELEKHGYWSSQMATCARTCVAELEQMLCGRTENALRLLGLESPTCSSAVSERVRVVRDAHLVGRREPRLDDCVGAFAIEQQAPARVAHHHRLPLAIRRKAEHVQQRPLLRHAALCAQSHRSIKLELHQQLELFASRLAMQ